MARDHRLRAAAGVLAFLVVVRCSSEGALGRSAWLGLVALPLGYGHLIGGAWLARGRLRRFALPGVSRGLTAALLMVSLASLLAAYAWALRRPALEPAVLAPMLLLSAWHIVENDLALADAAQSGRSPGGLRTAPRHHAGAAGITLLLALAALSTEEGAALGRRWLGLHLSAHALFGLDELVTGVLMYHAASWLLHLWTRPPRGRGAAAFRRELVLLHALPVALTATLYLLAPPLYAWLADPLLYLFWSVLHAVQTACARAVSAAGAEPAAA